MGIQLADRRHAAQRAHDRNLHESIHAALGALRDGRLRGVRVAVQNGLVFLAGEVPSYYAKQLAQHAAMRVPGAARVHNELVVDRGGLSS